MYTSRSDIKEQDPIFNDKMLLQMPFHI